MCLLAGVPVSLWAQTVNVSIGSNESGRQFSVTGTGCSPGPAYITPKTLQWTAGSSCTVEFVTPHSIDLERRHIFTTWQDGVALNPRVFTAPVQAASYTALFTPQYKLTVEISPTGGGTVSGPDWVHSGTEPTLVATPAPGYRFVRWSNVDEESGTTAKVRVSYARTVYAQFATASSAMTTGYTVLPVLAATYDPPLLNDYGQVVQRTYGASSDLWTPQTANAMTGTISAVPVYYPKAINSRGQVLAQGTSGASIVLWSPVTANAPAGTTGTIEVPAYSVDLNDYGQVGGGGYLWTPSVANGTSGTAVQNSRFEGMAGINNYGQAAMLSTTVVTLFTPSSPRSGTGTFTNISAPSGRTFRSVGGINNTGAIAGGLCSTNVCDDAMFIWRPSVANSSSGTLEVVAPPAGFSSIVPSAINDSGEIVGTMSLAGGGYYFYGSVPFLYKGGVVYDLTTADPSFRDASKLTINNAGQIAFTGNESIRVAWPAGVVTAPPSNAVPVTIQSNQFGAVFSVAGAGCQPGTYGAPRTLSWTPGSSCTVSFASPFAMHSDRRQVFLSWQDSVATNPRVFPTPSKATTYMANFDTQFRLQAEIVPSGAGTVSGTGWVSQYTSTTLQAVPAAGYRFVEWSYNGGTSGSDSIQVNTYSPQTVRATFASIATAMPRQYAVVPVAASSYAMGPKAINDYGQIVGSPQDGQTAFLWTPSSANSIAGTLSSLASITGVSPARATKINNRGQIAAIRPDSRPFLWSPVSPNAATGTTTPISDIGLEAPTTINDYGQMAGVKWIWTPSAANGSAGALVQNTGWTGVADINNAGQMLVAGAAGWRVFTPASRGTSTGTYAPIGAPAGSYYTMAALNSDGKVAGDVCTSGEYEYSCLRRGFLSEPSAGTSAFTEIAPPPGFATLNVRAMNDAGDVVGVMSPQSGSPFPFLYSNSTVYDLSTANPVLRGGTADGINNAGQIVVNANSTVYIVSPLGGVTPPPTQVSLTLSHSELRFGTTVGLAPNGQQQVQVTLTGTNASSTAWSATSNQHWVHVTPASGTGSGKFLLTIAGASTALPGTLEGRVTVTTGSTTKTVRVYLTIAAATATSPPFGFIDLPANNSNVSGAVGVTGWALDDIEVMKIEVWRKSVPGEPHLNGQVFVGNGIFLDGARPDIANAYPAVPLNTRGGWGMQILTNMLPNAAGTGPVGNGQHQLFVYAFDKEGKSTLLGSRTINVNNSGAVKPFGTLDTPASGGTASGTQYTVWGWALTPQPATIPVDGSTLWVFVDGVSIAHPVYNLYRADVSTLFPGLQNSSGPVGYYYLDTTRLANGMHSIAWSVTDNVNRVEGIGSRLFYVQNSGVAAASAAPASPKAMRSAEGEGVWFRTGYNPDAELRKLEGSVIEIEQGDRIELHVAGAESVEFDGNASLPVGSTFRGGVFYWQLDVAYIASYELKFREANGNTVANIVVRIR